jgi:predicted ArsR family transcriptional regulator
VAVALGIGVRLAAFHLDKLVNEGLLSAYYARPVGNKGGPGAGRPPKWYVAGTDGFDITLPPRRHDIAAMILLRSLEGPVGGSRERLLEEARRCGRGLAEQAASQDLEPLLSGMGYEPHPAPGQSIDLSNCPFHELADEDRDTVCPMNLALLQGITDVASGSYTPMPEQRAGFCCVRLIPGEVPGTGQAQGRTPGPSV